MVKESLYGIGKDLFYRETFNDLYTVENNNLNVTDIVIDEGTAVFNGSSSYITIGKIQRSETVVLRLIIKPEGNGTVIAQGSFDYRIRISSGQYLVSAKGVIDFPTGFNAIIGEWQEIILVSAIGNTDFYLNGSKVNVTSSTSINITENLWFIGARWSGSPGLYFNGSIKLVEIYEKALTEEDIINLSNNSRYLNFNNNAFFHVIFENGVIEEKTGKSSTVTDVNIYKDGGIWTSRYNGSTSKIIFNSPFDISNAFTLSIWCKILKNKNSEHGIISDGTVGFFIRYDSSGAKQIYAQIYDLINSITISSGPIVDLIQKWSNIVMCYDGNVYLALYLNGKYYTSKTATTPLVSRIISNIYLGIRSSSYLDGLIGEVLMEEDPWSDEKINQYYNSTKFKYIG